MRWAIYPTCHVAAVPRSDWLSHIAGNAISLNRDTKTSSVWQRRILLICLSARGELKMKSNPAYPLTLPFSLEGTRRLRKDCLSLFWVSSKQRRIDGSVFPFAPRPVLTSALLRVFVQPKWLKHLTKIYLEVRDTRLSEGDGLLGRRGGFGFRSSGASLWASLRAASLDAPCYSQGELWMHGLTESKASGLGGVWAAEILR